MGEDGHLGPVTCREVRVPLDEVADLADDLIGGPVAVLDMAGARVGGFGERHYEWRLTARALIAQEAAEALEQARVLLLDGLDEQRAPRQMWRLRAGELCPQGQGRGEVPGPAV
jgi:hypothetical protein